MIKYFIKTSLLSTLVSLTLPIYSQKIDSYNLEYLQNLDSINRSVYINSLSNDGNWIAYTKIFNLNTPITYLQSIQDSVTVKLGTTNNLKISPNSNWLVYSLSDNRTVIRCLTTDEQFIYENIKIFDFSPSGNYISLLSSKGKLVVFNMLKKSSDILDSISEYKWNSKEDLLALITVIDVGNKLKLLNIAINKTDIISTSENASIQSLQWNENGDNLFWKEKYNDKFSLVSFSVKGVKKTLNNNILSLQIPGTEISDKDFIVSKDGNYLYFKRKMSQNHEIQSDKEINQYQIWNANDRWVFPKYDNFRKYYLSDFYTVWNLNSDKILEITDEEFPVSQFNPSHTYALIFNPLQYEPQFKEAQYVDIYLKCFRTGRKNLIIKNQYNKNGFVKLSPSGRYIMIFKNHDWMLYDTVLKTFSNLTKGLDAKFYDSTSGDMDNPNPFGSPGWTEDEKYIIIYDEFDVWFLKPKETKWRKITNGKINNQVYRINLNSYAVDLMWAKRYRENLGVEFSTEKLILDYKIENDIEGFTIVNENLQVSDLYQVNSSLRGVTISDDLKKIAFINSNYYSPHSISIMDRNKLEVKNLFKHQKKFNSIYSTIYFSDTDKSKGKAKLLYPLGFDSTKKYPMIVWIYQDMTRKFKEFRPPTLLNPDGFNILWYLTNEYFVLLPDIKYENMNPGISALNSVNSAVDESLKFPFINKEKVGLIGHSFGGYEALFIATHSDKFATIVAGNSVSNLNTFYYSICWQFSYEEFWRVQHNQHKMIKSPVELPQNYYNNSPMEFVQDIDTPIFIWAGKKDKNVNWNESLQFYLAMRRYKKEGKFLIFENDEHVLDNPQNQLHLSLQIFNWFNLYLK